MSETFLLTELTMELNEITEKIIHCAYTVANVLGAGFLENVYENALTQELRKSGPSVAQQKEAQVRYDGITVGDYRMDRMVQDAVVVELKAAKAIDERHLAQCRNFLRGSGYKLCLLINFGTPRIEVKRVVYRL